MRSIISYCMAGAVALVFASGAWAAESPETYIGESGGAQQGVSGGASGGALGQLPFTGLELTLLVGVGLALLILGLGLRRTAAKRV